MHSGKAAEDIEDVKLLATLNNEDLTATMMKHIKYFDAKNSLEKFMKQKLHFLTIWIVADLNEARGRDLLASGLRYMIANSGVRLTFLPNTDKADGFKGKKDFNAIIWSILNTFDGKEATDKALRVLESDEAVPDIVKGFLHTAELHLKMIRVYCQRVLKFKSGATSVIINGKIFGPLDDNESFTTDDFSLLDKINQQQYISKVKESLKSIKTEEFELELSSDLMVRLLSLLMPRKSSKNRFNIPTDLREDFTVVKLPPKAKDEPSFNIVGVVDPASRAAQKLAPLLILLRQVVNCDLKVSCYDVHYNARRNFNFYLFRCSFAPSTSTPTCP